MRILILALFALVLTACGGSGSDSSSSTSSSNISNFSLSFSAVKSFDFTWTDSSDATYYKLMENKDGNSGFTQVGSNISSGTQTYSHIVPLYARMNAQYILQGCNDTGCTDSDTISVDDTLVDSVGYVKASNTEMFDWFGDRLALSGDGDTLAVSTKFEDSNATGINGDQTNNSADDSGAVYIFTRNSNNNWSQQAYIKASNTASNDYFGESLSISSDGNTLAVGAYGEDSNAIGIDNDQSNNDASLSGAAYVFIRDSDNNWIQQAYLKASNTEAGDYFGANLSLSSDGDTLAIGSRREDSNATTIGGDEANNDAENAGAVYVFMRNSTVWSQQAYLKASNAEANDSFGGSLSLSSDGDTLAVGATGEGSNATGVNGTELDNSEDSSGAVYVFIRDTGNNWAQHSYIKASNTQNLDAFGSKLALSEDGSTLAVSATGEDSSATGINGSQNNDSYIYSGATYVFSFSNNTWSQQAYIKASNSDQNDLFGDSLSLSSDGNTLAVGATREGSNSTGIGGNQESNNTAASGAVYVFTRSDSDWSQQAYVKASNGEGADTFGQSLALSADGNTLAIGANREESSATGIGGDQTDNSAEKSGAAYLY